MIMWIFLVFMVFYFLVVILDRNHSAIADGVLLFIVGMCLLFFISLVASTETVTQGTKQENIYPIKDNFFVQDSNQIFYYKNPDGLTTSIHMTNIEFIIDENIDENNVQYYNYKISLNHWWFFPFSLNEENYKAVIYLKNVEDNPIIFREMKSVCTLELD